MHVVLVHQQRFALAQIVLDDLQAPLEDGPLDIGQAGQGQGLPPNASGQARGKGRKGKGE
jgi:hypothetical protein